MIPTDVVWITGIAALKICAVWGGLALFFAWLAGPLDLPWEDRALVAALAPWAMAYLVGELWGWI